MIVLDDYRITDGPYDAFARRILDLQQQLASRDMIIHSQSVMNDAQSQAIATQGQQIAAQSDHSVAQDERVASLDRALGSFKQQVEQLTARLHDAEWHRNKAEIDAKIAEDSKKARRAYYDRRVVELDQEKEELRMRLRNLAENI